MKLLILTGLLVAVGNSFAGTQRDWEQWRDALWQVAQRYNETDEYRYWEIHDAHEVFRRDFEAGLSPLAAWKNERTDRVRNTKTSALPECDNGLAWPHWIAQAKASERLIHARYPATLWRVEYCSGNTVNSALARIAEDYRYFREHPKEHPVVCDDQIVPGDICTDLQRNEGVTARWSMWKGIP